MLLLLAATLGTFQAADPIRAGHPDLRSRPLAAGPDTIIGERVVDGVRTPQSSAIRTVRREGDLLRIRVEHTTVSDGLTTVNEALVRASDYAVTDHYIRSPRDSGRVTMTGTVAKVWSVPAGKPRSERDVPWTERVLPDDGIAPYWIGVLPLRDGYAGKLTTFNLWSAEYKVTPFKVVGRENVTLGTRVFDCWMVETPGFGPAWKTVRYIDAKSGVMVQQWMTSALDKTKYWTHLKE